MKSFRILAGFMVVFLVAFLSLSAAADTKDDDDSGRKKGKKLPKHARVLQKQIKANTAAIENIELTPGPKGAPGTPGADGAKGADGQDGADGAAQQVLKETKEILELQVRQAQKVAQSRVLRVILGRVE